MIHIVLLYCYRRGRPVCPSVSRDQFRLALELMWLPLWIFLYSLWLWIMGRNSRMKNGTAFLVSYKVATILLLPCAIKTNPNGNHPPLHSTRNVPLLCPIRLVGPCHSHGRKKHPVRNGGPFEHESGNCKLVTSRSDDIQPPTHYGRWEMCWRVQRWN